jgi:hypothetical protein
VHKCKICQSRYYSIDAQIFNLRPATLNRLSINGPAFTARLVLKLDESVFLGDFPFSLTSSKNGGTSLHDLCSKNEIHEPETPFV